jgi:hypothetical protein
VGLLLSKFMIASKLAGLLNGVFIGLEKTFSLVGIKYGKTTGEQLDEIVLGTVYLVLRAVGQAGIDRLKKQDTNGTFKDVAVSIEIDGQQPGTIKPTPAVPQQDK